MPNIRKIFVNTSVSTRKYDGVKRQRGVEILLHYFLTLGSEVRAKLHGTPTLLPGESVYIT